MTWRIIEIGSICKLDLKLGYLMVRKGNDDIRKVHLSEISTLIIENTAVSLTAALLCELSKHKVNVIFCDESRNPYGELVPYYGSHDSAVKLKKQIAWGEEAKRSIWAEIVKKKILMQSAVLQSAGLEQAAMLKQYSDEVLPGDTSNREGHAAKVYFNALFGKGFSRNEDSVTNACLNYGYDVLLSAVNREVSISGYSTQLGIFHDNEFNPFNLGCDLMEPFRPFIDRCVYETAPLEMSKAIKLTLVDVLNRQVSVEGKANYLINGLRTYCKSVFDAIESNDVSLIRFCDVSEE